MPDAYRMKFINAKKSLETTLNNLAECELESDITAYGYRRPVYLHTHTDFKMELEIIQAENRSCKLSIRMSKNGYWYFVGTSDEFQWENDTQAMITGIKSVSEKIHERKNPIPPMAVDIEADFT